MNLDDNLTELLSEEELRTIIAHIDIKHLLVPVVQNKNMYSHLVKKLGRMDVKSKVVNKMLPGMVITQVKRNDKNYTEILLSHLQECKNTIEKFFEGDEKRNTLKHDVPEGYASLYLDYKKDVDESCDLSFFLILLKVVGVELSENMQTQIAYSVEQHNKNEHMIANYEMQIKKLKHEHQCHIEQMDKDYSKKIKDSQQEIRRLNEVIQGKKDTLEEIWKKETEEKHCKRIKKLEDEYELKITELKNKYRDESESLERDWHEKKKCITNNIEEELEQVKSEYEIEKKRISGDIQKLGDVSRELAEKKESLKIEIEALEKRNASLQAYIDDYFQHFEEHAIQLRLDALLKSRIGKIALELPINESAKLNNNTLSNKDQFLTYGGTSISNGEYIDPTEDFEDMLTDLKDNISVYFDDPYEIAKLVFVALSIHKSMIIDSFSAQKIGDALSALVDEKYITVLDLSDGKYELKEVVKFINDMSEQVILIDGIIDRFDDKSLSSICCGCPEKNIIFSYAEKSTLDMISKSYLKYGIPYYFEGKLSLPSNLSLLTSNQIYQRYLPVIDIQECKQIYKNHLSKLYEDGYLTKSLALEVASFISVYKAIGRGGKTSDLAKETIQIYFNSKVEAEKKQELLDAFI